jgi:hypothetical protein
MDDTLLRRYLEYASSEEAKAVLFAKNQIAQAKGHWVDILNCRRYYESEDPFHFKFVTGGLFRRRIQPQYPPRSTFSKDGRFDERRYYLAVRAITWEAAHRDIEQQKSKRASHLRFKITGIVYVRLRAAKNFFRDDAPPEIKALANNLNVRTNPLWDRAVEYINRPELVYKAKLVYLN